MVKVKGVGTLVLALTVSAAPAAAQDRLKIDVSGLELLAANTTANAAQAQTAPRREPALAAVLSLVFPGIGQLYNGESEKRKGFTMMGVSAGAIAVMMIGATQQCDIEDVLENGSCSTSLMWIGWLAHMGNMGYSLYDAYSGAVRINRERGFTINLQPEIRPGHNGVRASTTYALSW